MVVWVYAGGGEAEAAGFVPLLQRHHVRCTFRRQTPIPRPGPRPNAPVTYAGNSGRSLSSEIRRHIDLYWDGSADVILVLDDTDDASPAEREIGLRQAVMESLAAKGIDPASVFPKVIVALAVPELEIWVLADWNNTLKKAFPDCERAARRDLGKQQKVDFKYPEAFVVRDGDGTYHKISDIIKEVIAVNCIGIRYSKATDTPRLLLNIDPSKVSGKCPYFRRWWTSIAKLCGQNA